MTTIPSWWLFLSGLFFFTNACLFVGLIFALQRIAKVAEDTKPMIDELSTKMNALVTTVDGVAHKVDLLADSAKLTLESVDSKTKSVMGSAELIASSASKSFERFSPYIMGAMTAFRVIKAVADLRGPKKSSNDKSIRRR